MRRWNATNGFAECIDGVFVSYEDHCAEVESAVNDYQKHSCKMARERDEMLVERNNAEKREYEILGRANSLQKRLDISDSLLREEFAKRQDAYAVLREIVNLADSNSFSTDDVRINEIRKVASEFLKQ